MLYVVGIGPGNKEEMTTHALNAIKQSDVIVGYKTYIDLVKEHIADKEVVVNGMRGEVERCTRAVELASEGKNVAVISSGDPGVYAMSGLVLEIVSTKELDLDIEIVPGITSANGASASLGAPIMHDHAYISLSDLLTDFELIKKRLSLAAEGDFVICLFNPKSKGRPTHIHTAQEILLQHKSEDTVVGIVNNAKREGEKVTITTLGKMLTHHIDMTTMVVIGNSKTYQYQDFMITPRGVSRVIAVFSGTSDGRLAVDWLMENSFEVVCFNATSYGGSLYKGITVYDYPMDLEMIQSKLLEHEVTDIIDCTHPFAEVISKNLMSASHKLKIPYYRFERPELESEHYDTYDDILKDINQSKGNIFLTIGSNNLELFTQNVDISRLYCRVLPTEVVIKKCYELGLSPKQIIGMQGPFDTALNQAMFHSLDIKHLVTKASGHAGGFKEKLEAAKTLNIHTYVLGRPMIEYVNLYRDLKTLIKDILGGRK